MSENLQSNNIQEEQSENVCDKQQLLVEKANNTFLELCKTLENEQTKLLELEERRKKLQEEMLLLKAEIEEEKHSYNLNLVQSVATNLSALNNASNNNDKVCDQNQMVYANLKGANSYVCYKDEEHQPVTARNLSTISSKEFISEESVIEEHV